jgi:DNA-directed RNA polymerase subunit M/transcription elongation factor TFIIS
MSDESCPKCGSNRLVFELRDPARVLEGTPPRESFGAWTVCERCGHEWPSHDEDKDRQG